MISMQLQFLFKNGLHDLTFKLELSKQSRSVHTFGEYVLFFVQTGVSECLRMQTRALPNYMIRYTIRYDKSGKR